MTWPEKSKTLLPPPFYALPWYRLPSGSLSLFRKSGDLLISRFADLLIS
jgi:hypothetical protein